MDESQNKDKRQIETRSPREGLGELSLFNRNAHFAFIYKKTEKLVTAVYMITNFIKDNEPLKWKLREKSLDLLEVNLSFNTVSLSERKDLMKDYQAMALEIVSLSGIANNSGLISEMNHLILSKEFTNLVSMMETDENKAANEETVMLHSGFFDVAKPKPQEYQKDMGVGGGDAAKRISEQDSFKGQFSSARQDDTSQYRKSSEAPIKDMKERSSKPAESKDNRQNIILKLLSKRSGLNIKDFAESIRGVSAKTIQRELLSMVAAGVLKKEGERRWSTYSLAK